MKRTCRLLSLLLAAAMLLALAPGLALPARAEGEPAGNRANET